MFVVHVCMLLLSAWVGGGRQEVVAPSVHFVRGVTRLQRRASCFAVKKGSTGRGPGDVVMTCLPRCCCLAASLTCTHARAFTGR